MRGPMNLGSRSRAFTFPEALVTIAVLILFASVAGGLYFQGRSLAERQDRETRLLQEKASLASVLPVVCQSVQPPEWGSPAQAFEESGGILTARYWNSDAEAAVTFQVASGVLTVRTPEISQEWKTLDGVSV